HVARVVPDRGLECLERAVLIAAAPQDETPGFVGASESRRNRNRAIDGRPRATKIAGLRFLPFPPVPPFLPLPPFLSLQIPRRQVDPGLESPRIFRDRAFEDRDPALDTARRHVHLA